MIEAKPLSLSEFIANWPRDEQIRELRLREENMQTIEEIKAEIQALRVSERDEFDRAVPHSRYRAIVKERLDLIDNILGFFHDPELDYTYEQLPDGTTPEVGQYVRIEDSYTVLTWNDDTNGPWARGPNLSSLSAESITRYHIPLYRRLEPKVAREFNTGPGYGVEIIQYAGGTYGATFLMLPNLPSWIKPGMKFEVTLREVPQ